MIVAEVRGRFAGCAVGSDRYMKREDCGVIYAVCVEERYRRSLVGAMLVRSLFDRWPWGVRLACCWCAQDLRANSFWELLGFMPLAYRGGSSKKNSVARVLAVPGASGGRLSVVVSVADDGREYSGGSAGVADGPQAALDADAADVVAGDAGCEANRSGSEGEQAEASEEAEAPAGAADRSEQHRLGRIPLRPHPSPPPLRRRIRSRSRRLPWLYRRSR